METGAVKTVTLQEAIDQINVIDQTLNSLSQKAHDKPKDLLQIRANFQTQMKELGRYQIALDKAGEIYSTQKGTLKTALDAIQRTQSTAGQVTNQLDAIQAQNSKNRKKCSLNKSIVGLTLGGLTLGISAMVQFKNHFPKLIAESIPSPDKAIEFTAQYIPTRETVGEWVSKAGPSSETVSAFKDAAANATTSISHLPGNILAGLYNDTSKLAVNALSFLPTKESIAAYVPIAVQVWDLSGTRIVGNITCFDVFLTTVVATGIISYLTENKEGTQKAHPPQRVF